MLGEVDGQAKVRRMVKSVDESIHNGSRQQLQVVDPGEYLRVEKLRVLHIPDFGSGTASSNMSMS